MDKMGLKFSLPLDNQVRQMGIPMASGCNCCIQKNSETLDHVMCNGKITRFVLKQVATSMRICNVENKKLKVKNYSVVQKCQEKFTYWQGLLPVIITWRL